MLRALNRLNKGVALGGIGGGGKCATVLQCLLFEQSDARSNCEKKPQYY